MQDPPSLIHFALRTGSRESVLLPGASDGPEGFHRALALSQGTEDSPELAWRTEVLLPSLHLGVRDWKTAPPSSSTAADGSRSDTVVSLFVKGAEKTLNLSMVFFRPPLIENLLCARSLHSPSLLTCTITLLVRYYQLHFTGEESKPQGSFLRPSR